MRRITTALVLVALGLAAAACGSSGGGGTVDGSAPRRVPTGADDVVLRVDTRGGFTPVEYQLGIVPELSIFGDGRVVVTGPVTEQYPPYALPNLLTGTLPRAEVEQLIQEASDAGLLGRPLDFGQPGVTDLPTTTVTVATLPPCLPDRKCGVAQHVQEAYALGYQPAGGDRALTAAQREARDRLRAFVDDATAAATTVATEPYRASEVAVFVRTAPDGIDDGVAPGHAEWPLGDLAGLGTPIGGPGVDTSYRCAVLAGTDAERALAAAAGASSITRWRSTDPAPGTAATKPIRPEYLIVFRPLLPDEHACP